MTAVYTSKIAKDGAGNSFNAAVQDQDGTGASIAGVHTLRNTAGGRRQSGDIGSSNRRERLAGLDRHQHGGRHRDHRRVYALGRRRRHRLAFDDLDHALWYVERFRRRIAAAYRRRPRGGREPCDHRRQFRIGGDSGGAGDRQCEFCRPFHRRRERRPTPPMSPAPAASSRFSRGFLAKFPAR